MQTLIDVFMLDFNGGNQLRVAMSEVCQNRWHFEPQARFFRVTPKTPTFHIEGKRRAEERSESPVYVVADNDCLILGENFVERGVEILGRHPEYGLLAAANICEGEFSSGIDWQGAGEVVERPQVGGIAFVRKGILTDFKAYTPPQVDTVICDEINAKGYKTGIIPAVRFNHIGAGYSLSNPSWWMKVPE